MSINNLNHEHCSVCGRKLEYKGMEKSGKSTLMFYACPLSTPTNDHDRAVYELGDDVEVA